MKLTAGQIAAVAQAAGFTGGDLVTAVAIAFAESGGEANAQNHNSDSHHSTDLGLWQINDYWEKDILATGSWSVPMDNARMAFQTYVRAGRRFTPWVTYNRKLHIPFMGQAMAGVAAIDPTYVNGSGPGTYAGTSADGTVTASSDSSLQTLSDFAHFITNPKGWIRIGLFTGGAILVTLAAKSVGKGM